MVYLGYFQKTTFSPSLTSGTCSSLTEELLQEPACKRVIQQQQGLIKNTLQIILINSCVNNPFKVVFELPNFRIKMASHKTFKWSCRVK